MSFCDHCQGQRFDRARVLRALREARKQLRQVENDCGDAADIALGSVIETVRKMEIPHIEWIDEVTDSEVVH
jgi:hypothetical protein